MNKAFVGISCVLGLFQAAIAHAATPPIAVSRFEQEVDHIYEGCRGWQWSRRNQLQTELESRLRMKGLRVLERKDIQAIYDGEFEFPNLDDRSKPRRKRMVSAKYVITGGVTELGICEESSANGIQIGGLIGLFGGPDADLQVGFESAVSKVKLVANLVAVESAEIVQTFTALESITDSGTQVRAEVAGIGAKHGSRKTLPIERASSAAIDNLSNQIRDFLMKE